MKMEIGRTSSCFLSFTLAFLLSSCGGSQHPRPVTAGATNAPQFIELRREVRANTLHFPAGTYALSSADKIGYYYRAPRKIVQHAAGGSVLREGGIFVSKRNREKLRGYIYLGGAVTHVGNFSRADYAFRSATTPEDTPAENPY
jgi:hypothetical protein